MLLKEIFHAYFENHMKHINILRGKNTVLLNAEAGGIYSYHSDSKLCIAAEFYALFSSSFLLYFSVNF
jgi:hypothetical protein